MVENVRLALLIGRTVTLLDDNEAVAFIEPPRGDT
jgi:hypothetical protein